MSATRVPVGSVWRDSALGDFDADDFLIVGRVGDTVFRVYAGDVDDGDIFAGPVSYPRRDCERIA